MAKKAEKIIDVLPDIVKNIGQYAKELTKELTINGKEYIDSATGTTAIIIKLLGKPLLDSYFKKIEKNKLDNLGFNSYLLGAFNQAVKSLEVIQDELDKNELSHPALFAILQKTIIEETAKFNNDLYLPVLNPQYHSSVLFVKNNYLRVLEEIGVQKIIIDKFIKNFNEDIESSIKTVFGNAYDKHLEEIKGKRLGDAELKLLYHQKNNAKIGFKESENLKYEQAYGSWIALGQFLKSDNHNDDYESNISKQEKNLKPINTLIEDYFNNTKVQTIKKILFIVSDFGKGKSVFLKQYASELASEYINNQDGYFPIYFNLRNFNRYNSENKLGVISNFLENDFGIKIDNDYFKKKKYIFLIDSLDESGELTEFSINKVIESVKSIQNIDKENCRENRIIITTRPLDVGLIKNIKANEPYEQIISEKPTFHYLSIYGFKKDQFNDWLVNSLQKVKIAAPKGYTKELITQINSGNIQIDIFQKLLNEKTLKPSELRRPIFAYMVYQLIIHNIDFLDLGKIGVYLSFLNLLTKEAKHIHDKDYENEVNIVDEIKYRNILHGISKLWMYQRHCGNQGFLKKADICRVLEGEKISEDDNKVLEKYKASSVSEVKFLSHSYFGENNNILHFQHQSFAEILLAEYYLKTIIKFALDEGDINEVESRLFLGEPTEQTIQFLKELVKLLKESITNENDNTIREKRKLLFPLFASLCTKENNKDLFCSSLYYEWYKKNETAITNEIPDDYINNWCINEEKLEKIIFYTERIIKSGNFYCLGEGIPKDLLFNKELLNIQFTSGSRVSDISKWIALLVGNELETNLENLIFFNQRLKNPLLLIRMIRNWNSYTEFQQSTPHWANSYFRGSNFVFDGYETFNLNRHSFSYIDFSYSKFVNFVSNYSSFDHCNFFSTLPLSSCVFKIHCLCLSSPIPTNLSE